MENTGQKVVIDLRWIKLVICYIVKGSGKVLWFLGRKWKGFHVIELVYNGSSPVDKYRGINESPLKGYQGFIRIHSLYTSS